MSAPMISASVDGLTFVGAQELADVFGVERATVHHWVRANKVPVIRYGSKRSKVFVLEDVTVALLDWKGRTFAARSPVYCKVVEARSLLP